MVAASWGCQALLKPSSAWGSTRRRRCLTGNFAHSTHNKCVCGRVYSCCRGCHCVLLQVKYAAQDAHILVRLCSELCDQIGEAMLHAHCYEWHGAGSVRFCLLLRYLLFAPVHVCCLYDASRWHLLEGLATTPSSQPWHTPPVVQVTLAVTLLLSCGAARPRNGSWHKVACARSAHFPVGTSCTHDSTPPSCVRNRAFADADAATATRPRDRPRLHAAHRQRAAPMRVWRSCTQCGGLLRARLWRRYRPPWLLWHCSWRSGRQRCSSTVVPA